MIDRIGFVAIVTAALSVFGCRTDPRTDWPELGIGIDHIGITKTLVSGKCCYRGNVRSIQLGNFDEDPDREVAVVAQTGVVLFDAATLQPKADLAYQTVEGGTIWFGLSPFLVQDKAGFKIAKRGGGFGEIGLLDGAGTELWKFKPTPERSPDEMAVDNTVLGKPQFYVTDGDLVYKLDADGNIVWKVTASALHIALVRDEDGMVSDFATTGSGSPNLDIWSTDGKRKDRLELPFRPDGFEFVGHGTVAGFVIKSGWKIAFVDRVGKHLFTRSYGSVPVFHGPSAVLVRLAPGQTPVLAVRFASRSATGKSVLSLFALDGALLYEEYLEGGSALGVVPADGEDRDKLLVGEGTSKVWVYEHLRR